LSRDKVDVLLRFEPASASNASLPADADFPLVWTKMYGQGRVVYSSLSHSTEAWDIRNVQTMMFEAIRWSLGLSEVPVEPHAKRNAPAKAAK
jgi:type 1 glutamine amidotransferase